VQYDKHPIDMLYETHSTRWLVWWHGILYLLPVQSDEEKIAQGRLYSGFPAEIPVMRPKPPSPTLVLSMTY
jgi:hypothetical protein